jgi:hypothetical protein
VLQASGRSARQKSTCGSSPTAARVGAALLARRSCSSACHGASTGRSKPRSTRCRRRARQLTYAGPGLELAALQYDIPGPWAASEDPDGADTTAAIRAALDAGDREAARTLAEARLQALVVLHARLAPSYLGAVA